jgi:hypothetical protein
MRNEDKMMEFYVDAKQYRSAVGSSWWFDFNEEQNKAVEYWLAMLIESDEEAIAEAAEDVLNSIEEWENEAPDAYKYSSNIFVRVGGYVYTIYALCGHFRVGAEGSVSCRDEGAKQVILDYFNEVLPK